MIHDPDTYLLFLECHRRFRYEDGILVYRISVDSNKIKAGTPAGGEVFGGYKAIKINNRRIYTHKAIFFMKHGYLPACVDHIDCNVKNNRIENLRPATKIQNGQNTMIRITNTSGIKGVSRHKATGKWVSQGSANGKRFHLGLFDNIHDAEIAARSFREKYHGEYANHGEKP